MNHTFSFIALLLLLVILMIILCHRYSTLRGRIQEEAQRMFEDWRRSELDAVKRQIETALEEKYKGLFSQWIQEKEGEIPQDAIARSQSVVLGRVTEHLVLYLPEFEFNPRDARF